MVSADKDVAAEAQGDGVTLGPQDVRDAVRLIRMLLSNAELPPAAATPALSTGPGTTADTDAAHDLAGRLLRMRRGRSRHFPQSMFGEPAWDMLLALYLSASGGRRHTISTLADISGAPLTTTLRWLDHLQQSSLVERGPSPTDKRVTFVRLTPDGHRRLTAYLHEMLQGAGDFSGAGNDPAGLPED